MFLLRKRKALAISDLLRAAFDLRWALVDHEVSIAPLSKCA